VYFKVSVSSLARSQKTARRKPGGFFFKKRIKLRCRTGATTILHDAAERPRKFPALPVAAAQARAPTLPPARFARQERALVLTGSLPSRERSNAGGRPPYPYRTLARYHP
jgi:hypothetical protein